MGSRACLTIRLLIGANHIEDVLQKQTGPAIPQEKTKLHGKKLRQGEQHPYYNLVLSCLLSPHLALPWTQRKEVAHCSPPRRVLRIGHWGRDVPGKY